MTAFGSVLAALPLVAFYLWMFDHMLKNERLGPAPLAVSPAKDFKYNWTLDFLFLNLIAAAIYFATEYRESR
jgi:hypothetical protein